MHGVVKAGLLVGAVGVVGGGALLIREVRENKQERSERRAALPESLATAIDAASETFRAAHGSADSSAMASSLAVRDASNATALVRRWNDAYATAPGSSLSGGIIATAAVDRDLSTTYVDGKFSDFYHEIRGASEPSAILAVTAVDTGRSVQSLNRLYGDIDGPAFESAILADAAARHGKTADDVNALAQQALEGSRGIGWSGAARLVAAHLDSGRPLAQLNSEFDAIYAERDISRDGAAILAAAGAAAGVDSSSVIERYRQMSEHLPGTSQGVAVIVAGRLFGEAHGDTPAPTYTYALEDPYVA